MADPKKAGMISGMSPLAIITGDELMEVSSRQRDGTWKTFSILINKIRTNQGLSAYEVAVKNGYQGTEQEWLETLVGKSAYDVAKANGFVGTEAEFLASLVGPSAYAVAVENGFDGTEAEWLDSLKGKSAFEVAKANGFVGTEAAWLASLKGESAYAIAKAIDPTIGTEAEWLETLIGKSAYEVAKANGFVGTEAAWLDSLKGKSAYQIWVAAGGVGDEATFLDSLKGQDGLDGESAYDTYKALPGNANKTEAEFITSLKGQDGKDGTDGTNGESAYETYKSLPGNESKTEADFIASLKGAAGKDGTNGTNGTNGKSAYQTWLEIPGNEGKPEADFIASLRGTNGTNGTNGKDGESAYQTWLALPGNAGKTEAEFLASLKGAAGTDGTNGTNGTNGQSAYELWKAQAGNAGKTEAEFLKSLEGKSAYKSWLDAGNVGDETAFLVSLKGDRGNQGDSAYQVWLADGHVGSQADFIASLKGVDGKAITMIDTLTQSQFDDVVAEGTAVNADAYWVGDFIYVFNGTDWVKSPNIRGKEGQGLNYLGEWPNASALPMDVNYVAGDTYVWRSSLWTMVETPVRRWVDIGVPGPAGKSAYQIWLDIGNTGNEQAFIDSLKVKGDTGLTGPDGLSAYDIAKANGFVGTEAAWLLSLIGKSAYEVAKANGFIGTEAEWVESLHGQSAYALWKSLPGNESKTEAEFIASLKGEKGEAAAAFEIIAQLTNVSQLPRPGEATKAYYVNKDLYVWFTDQADYVNLGSLDGASAYQIWLSLGNAGTEAEFIASLKGQDGTNGKSAYDTYKDLPGNASKTEAEFIASLKGADGKDGTNGTDGASAYDTYKALPGNASKTEAEFIASLKGQDGTNGTNGQSAYELAVATGFSGTEAEWIASLKGKNLQVNGTKADAATIQALPTPANQDAWVALDTGHLWIYATAAWVDAGPFRGTDGKDGESAYETYKAQPGNESKTEAEFLASLKGADGTNGTNGTNGRNVVVLGAKADLAAIQAVVAPVQQDAYTALDNSHLYMYIGTAWVDLGQFKGDKGDTGIAGPRGQGITIVANVTALTDRPAPATLNIGDSVYVEETGSLYQVNEAGVYGVGIKIQGQPGNDGGPGPAGPAGTSIQIMGSYANLAALQAAHATGNPGEGYLIGDNLYLYGVNPTGGATEWYNAGPVRGPQGIQGIEGPRGKVGATGTTGDRGSLWLTLPNGVDVPAANYGRIGDWAVNKTFTTFYKDETSGWLEMGRLVAGDVNSPLLGLGKVVRLGDQWVALPIDEVPNPVVDTQYVRKGIAGGKTTWAEITIPAAGIPEVPASTVIPQGRTSAGWTPVIAPPANPVAGKRYLWATTGWTLAPIQIDAPSGAQLDKILGYKLTSGGVGTWEEMTLNSYNLLTDNVPRTTSFTISPTTQNCYSVSGTTAGIIATLPKLADGRSMMCVFTIVGSTNKLSFAAGTGTPALAYNDGVAAADIVYGATQTIVTAFYNGFGTWIISKGPSF